MAESLAASFGLQRTLPEEQMPALWAKFIDIRRSRTPGSALVRVHAENIPAMSAARLSALLSPWLFVPRVRRRSSRRSARAAAFRADVFFVLLGMIISDSSNPAVSTAGTGSATLWDKETSCLFPRTTGVEVWSVESEICGRTRARTVVRSFFANICVPLLLPRWRWLCTQDL